MYLILPPQINNAKLYLAVFAAVLGNFNFGYSMVYPSPVLPKLQAPDTDPRLRLSTEQAAWFGSIYTLGAAAGGLGAMMLNDMIGRKVSILMSAVPSTIGWVRGSGKKTQRFTCTESNICFKSRLLFEAQQEDVSFSLLRSVEQQGSCCRYCHTMSEADFINLFFLLVWTVNLEKHAIKTSKEMTMTALCLALKQGH